MRHPEDAGDRKVSGVFVFGALSLLSALLRVCALGQAGDSE